MSDVTQILSAIDQGDIRSAEHLLPLIYDELRKLAVSKLAHEKPGQTLQATALVHEAYLRLVGAKSVQQWDGRGHFFVAAAEAMRRILVENARRKQSMKRGGQADRQLLDVETIAAPEPSVDILALDESLDKLAMHDAAAAKLVKLRYFSGLTMAQAAMALDVSPRTADRLWVYAKAWLYRDLESPRTPLN